VDGGTGDRIAAELGNSAGDMTALAAGIGTIVVAALHVQAIMLIAVANPILALLAGIGALAAWLGLGSAVKAVVENALKEHEFNTVSLGILHLAFSESRLEEKLREGRAAARAELKRNITASLDAAGEDGRAGIVATAAATFDAMVAQAIADLGVLEQLAKIPAPDGLAPDGPPPVGADTDPPD